MSAAPSMPEDLTGPQALLQFKKRYRENENDIESLSKDSKKRRIYGELCEDCLCLDIDSAFTATLRSRVSGVVLSDVGTRYRQPLQSTCHLCQILFLSRVEANDKDEAAPTDELRAFSFLWKFGGIDLINAPRDLFQEQNDSIVLAIVPSNYRDVGRGVGKHGQQNGFATCCGTQHQQASRFGVQKVSSRFAADQVKIWLEYCQKHHKTICRPKRTQTTGLRLIDCASKTINPAPGHVPYVALSYVWADKSNCDDECNNNIASKGDELPSQLSNVIADAMQVTKSLGHNFLWVDKFCIDQDDSNARHEQIKCMDSIYENAVLTIIAAAGHDEHYGLPGVGARNRKLQKVAEHPSSTIICSMQDPHMSIRSSRWATRGWTFQEAALSCRRLVFTEEQMYFECNAMNSYESINGPLELMHTKDKTKFRDFFRAGVFGRTDRQAFGRFNIHKMGTMHLFLLFLSYIEDYTSRNLRYDDDSLNAFAGVIRKFERYKNPILQVCGIPYPGAAEPAVDGTLRTYFMDGLTWNHKKSCWDEPQAPRRRPAFPSWTWAGWAGGIEYKERRYLGKPNFKTSVTSLSFELVSGTTVQLEELHSDNNVDTNLVRMIALRAGKIPTEAISYAENTKTWTFCGYPAEMLLSDGPDTPSELFDQVKSGTQWHCLYVGHSLKSTMALVLKSHENHFLRAGLLVIDEWHWTLEKAWKFDEEALPLFRIA